jgi:hypothetical protein
LPIPIAVIPIFIAITVPFIASRPKAVVTDAIQVWLPGM